MGKKQTVDSIKTARHLNSKCAVLMATNYDDL